MPIDFDKCIFEVLGKLTSQQLSAVCNFINSKVAIMENDIRKKLSIVDSSSNQAVALLENLGAGINAFNGQISSSALFDIARRLSPNCGPIGDLFGGALDLSEFTGQAVEDAAWMLKQLTSASAQANNALNHILDTTQGLKDICTIAQLLILEKTKNPDEIKATFKKMTGMGKGGES